MSELTFLHVHNRAMGYGRLGVDLGDALRRAGVDLYDDQGDRPDPDTHSEIPAGHRRPESPTNVVSWVSTPTHAQWWWKGQFASIFTMWETDNLPPAFRDTLHEFDLVIVPSEQNVDLFSRWADNVRYVPLGVDPERWHYIERTEPGRTFNFLIGGSGPRKGVDLAFHAFRKVFGDWAGTGPEPRLVMKSPRGESKYRGYERVDMVAGKLSDQEEQDLYAMAHCYLQPSRGEGFGLQPLQAMAQGIPTILTDAHGHAAFAKYGVGLSSTMTKADYFIFGDTHPPMQWWEPDFEELCEAMWDAYHNWEPLRASAEQVAKNVIPNQFTWDHVARNYIDAHDGALDLPYTGDGTAYFPEIEKFLVRVKHPGHRAEVGGVTHLWAPDKDYYEPADIKRLLFEADKLDLSCLQGDDHGLSDAQVAKLGAYSAQQEWCPTCGQKANSGVKRSDLIYDEMIA